MDRLDARYYRLVGVLLRNKMAVLAGAFCTLVMGAAFYKVIGSEMMPLGSSAQATSG